MMDMNEDVTLGTGLVIVVQGKHLTLVGEEARRVGNCQPWFRHIPQPGLPSSCDATELVTSWDNVRTPGSVCLNSFQCTSAYSLAAIGAFSVTVDYSLTAFVANAVTDRIAARARFRTNASTTSHVSAMLWMWITDACTQGTLVVLRAPVPTGMSLHCDVKLQYRRGDAYGPTTTCPVSELSPLLHPKPSVRPVASVVAQVRSALLTVALRFLSSTVIVKNLIINRPILSDPLAISRMQLVPVLRRFRF